MPYDKATLKFNLRNDYLILAINILFVELNIMTVVKRSVCGNQINLEKGHVLNDNGDEERVPTEINLKRFWFPVDLKNFPTDVMSLV